MIWEFFNSIPKIADITVYFSTVLLMDFHSALLDFFLAQRADDLGLGTLLLVIINLIISDKSAAMRTRSYERADADVFLDVSKR